MPAIALGLRALLVAVLAVAGFGKVRSAAAFRAAADALPVSSLPLLAIMTPRVMGALLVTAELLATVVLVIQPSAGLALGTALFLGMAGALAVVIRHGEQVQCRCFGADSGTLSWPHMVRALLLAAAAGTGLALTLIDPRPAHLAAAPAIGVIAGGIMAATVLVNWDLLLFLRTPAGAGS